MINSCLFLFTSSHLASVRLKMSFSTLISSYKQSKLNTCNAAYPFFQFKVRPQIVGRSFGHEVGFLKSVRYYMNGVVPRLLVWKVEWVLTDAGGGRATEVKNSAQQQDYDKREHLLQQLHDRIHRLLRPPILLLLLLGPPPLRVVILVEPALVEKHASAAPAEKHLEYVVRIYVLLSVLLMIPRSIIFSAMLIIDPSLPFIA